MKGMSADTFAPQGQVTRAQLAQILYAKSAMQWVTAVGVMNGDTAGRLNPRSTATRAEIATMLMNFDRSVK